MKIRETGQRNLKLQEEQIRTTKKGLRYVKNNLDFQEEEWNQEEEADEWNGSDPARFMNRREEREWNRLSEHKRVQFIKQGLKNAGIHRTRQRPGQRMEQNIKEEFQDEKIRQESAERKLMDHSRSVSGFPGRTEKGFRMTHTGQVHKIQKTQCGMSETETRRQLSETGNIQGRREAGRQVFSSDGGTPPTVSISPFPPAGHEPVKGMASGGTGIAVAAGKKTAEAFRDALAARAAAVQKVQQNLKDEESFGALPKPVAYTAATFVTLITSLAAIAIQLVSTLFTALIAVLASILPLIAVLCMVVVVIVSVLVSFTSTNTAGYGLPPFVTEDMMEAFFEAQEESGIPVSSGVAQLIAESGYGLYGPGGESGEGLSRLAYDYRNLFGIKYFSSDQYASGAVDMQTGEETDGSHQEITAGFSVYPDYASCIRQRTWMLKREPYIGSVSAYLNRNDGEYKKEEAKNFIRGIRSAGWATAGAYAEKCIEHMDTYDLYRFDNMTLEEYKSGIGGGTYDGTVTSMMQNIVRTAETNTGTYPCDPNMCAAWVTGVYQAAGAEVLPYGNAIDMWNTYRGTGSASMENIPPGAVVCGSGSGYMGSIYGHVGVYLGNGMVAHNAGYHSIQTLEEWCGWQTAVCQGHQGWIGWVFPGGVPAE